MTTLKYLLKRIALAIMVFLISSTISFTLIRLLVPDFEAEETGMEYTIEAARRAALGYDRPIPVQLWRYVRGIITEGDFGVSWNINAMMPVTEMIARRLPPTILLSVYSMVIAIPLGIMLGIWAAVKKNKPTDHIISTSIMLFISVPNFVVAFFLQYFLGFRLGWFPVIVSSLFEAGDSWFSWIMIRSMVLPVLALSFGTIAGFARTVRAELTEELTRDYMLLARSKGLTRASAIRRHALRNSMVPVFPGILGAFFGIVSGSIIIEQIFAVGGMGPLFLHAVNTLDYDVFIFVTMFYLSIGLVSTIVADMSLGVVDPRIRMGER